MRLTNKLNLSFNLASDQLVSFKGEQDRVTIACESGVLWVTVEGSYEDLILKARESVSIDGGRLVVAQALERASFSVEETTASHVA